MEFCENIKKTFSDKFMTILDELQTDIVEHFKEKESLVELKLQEIECKQKEIESYNKVSFIKKMNKEMEKLKKQVSLKEKKIKTLQKKNTSLVEKNASLIQDNNVLNDKLKNITKLNVSFTQEKQTTKNKIDETIQELFDTDITNSSIETLELDTQSDQSKTLTSRNTESLQLQKEKEKDNSCISDVESHEQLSESTEKIEPQLEIKTDLQETESYTKYKIVKIGKKHKEYYVDEQQLVYKIKKNKSLGKLLGRYSLEKDCIFKIN